MESQEPQESPKLQKNNTTLIIIIITVIVLAGAAYWFLGGRATPEVETEVETAVEEEATSLGEEVYDAAQKQTAKELTENIPEVNPLEGIEANPYENLKNPFAR